MIWRKPELQKFAGGIQALLQESLFARNSPLKTRIQSTYLLSTPSCYVVAAV
jgi:hypothetical protein